MAVSSESGEKLLTAIFLSSMMIFLGNCSGNRCTDR